MGENFEIIGSESNIVYYNLNKQFTNIKKVIITSDIILNSFETNNIKELFQKLKQTNLQTYKTTFEENKDLIHEDLIRNELYKEIQERLKKNSDGLADIALQNYNFMSSVSNTKYTITLRCENFSISMYYEEKGQIISSIRNLIKKYLKFEGNLTRIQHLEKFQIEIYESEEIFKHIFLKKERDSLILSSAFGTQFQNPIDFDLGSEFYFSVGENFNFFKNKQTHAILREHTKLEEKEINDQEKILNNEELIKINESTKNINDALIEIVITPKKKIRIINLLLLENSINTNSENGFIIHKSTKNYNRISTITLRDNFAEESMNPKYLLIRTQEETKELLENLSYANYVDGIIFTFNFYNPILDKIGTNFDIDIIFFDKPLQKSLDLNIDLNNLTIENSNEEFYSSNPFSNIIQEPQQKNNEHLEKLNNINLDTINPHRSQQNNPNLDYLNSSYSQQQPQTNNQEYNQISDITKSIISSPESSSKNSSIDWGETPKLQSNSSNSKSAIGILADSVLNQKPKEQEQQPQTNHNEHQLNLNQFHSSDLVMNNINSNEINSIPNEEQTIKSFDDIFNSPNQNEEKSQNIQYPNQNYEQTNQFQNSFTQEQKQHQTIEQTEFQNNFQNSFSQSTTNKNIKILTTPNINSGHYFVDINSITQVTSGEIYFMTTNPNEITNSNIKYVFPISTIENPQAGSYLIINSTQDFFLIDKYQNNKFFISLSNIEQNIKETFIQTAINKLNTISLIISKTDIEIIKKYLPQIEEIFIKDLNSQEEYLTIKQSLN